MPLVRGATRKGTHNRKDRKNNSHQVKYTDYERI